MKIIDYWFRDDRYWKKYLWYMPFKRLYWIVWFAPASFIKKQNEKNCARNEGVIEYYRKMTPFLGRYFLKPEGEAVRWNWWKYLKKNKFELFE